MNTPTPDTFSHFSIRLATLTALAVAFFLTTLPSFAQVARFERLGFLRNGGNSQAWAVSGDGTTVVGRAIPGDHNDFEAFRWQNGEMEGLGFLPDVRQSSTAHAVSADGSVVVGRWANQFAALWENGETRVIHDPERCSNSYAWGVSSDGSIVVGYCTHAEGSTQEAVRWVDGEMEGLGFLPGSEDQAPFSNAYAISSDGSTIVGPSRNEVWPSLSAFRWTEAGGMEKLSDQSWAVEAQGVSADGSVIVGHDGRVQSPDPVAWRWEEGVGAQLLSPLPDGWTGALATDVSADGSIIIGRGHREDGIYRIFIWTENSGMRDLQEVLEEDFGLDLTGWGPFMYPRSGISDDGTVIVGTALNPEDGFEEGFRAEAPFGVTIADEATPEALADVLSAPNPNPASGTSTFTIAVEYGQHVAVEVFDALGRQVQTVYEGALAAGMSETLTLDASALPAGVYIIRATGEDFTRTRRVTVVR